MVLWHDLMMSWKKRMALNGKSQQICLKFINKAWNKVKTENLFVLHVR